MKIIMGFPSLGVLTSREIFLKRHILAEPAVVQELSGTSTTKKSAQMVIVDVLALSLMETKMALILPSALLWAYFMIQFFVYGC